LIDIEVPVGSTIYGAVEDFFKAAQAKYAAIRSVNVQNGVQNVHRVQRRCIRKPAELQLHA